MKTIQEIDAIKLKLEQKYIPTLNKIFRHMAADAKALYLVDKSIPVSQLVKNYSPEFLKVIRDAQRETIKVFGFDLRQDNEQKGYDFKVARYKVLFDLQIESKDEHEEITVLLLLDKNQAEKVSQQFALDASLFVANTSEEQVAYIDETNAKELTGAEKTATILFFEQQGSLQKEIGILEGEIRQLEFDAMLGRSESIATAKKKKLQDKLNATKSKLEELTRNKDKIIADNIEKTIIEKGRVRSPLIASQNVGMAEAWSRQREAELVNQNVPEIELKKQWQAIIDNRTRSSHVIADGQIVGINEMFSVGGYQAKNPRAENLPPEESMNCRCVAIYLNS